MVKDIAIGVLAAALIALGAFHWWIEPLQNKDQEITNFIIQQHREGQRSASQPNIGTVRPVQPAQ